MNLPETVAAETVTLQVPGQLYARARQTAGNQQALEQLLVSAMVSGLSLLDDLPDEMVMDMATLALLNDRALWRVARQTMPEEHYERMDELLALKSQNLLSVAQQQELDTYLAEYDRIVLQRAHAAVLLKQRDYDLSNPQILATPSSFSL
jgi:adenylate cyclase